jgi:hypothetical protein
MKNDNNINSSCPPLFILNIWSKGIIKNNVNVKLKKKLKDNNDNKDDKDDKN